MHRSVSFAIGANISNLIDDQCPRPRIHYCAAHPPQFQGTNRALPDGCTINFVLSLLTHFLVTAVGAANNAKQVQKLSMLRLQLMAHMPSHELKMMSATAGDASTTASRVLQKCSSSQHVELLARLKMCTYMFVYIYISVCATASKQHLRLLLLPLNSWETRIRYASHCNSASIPILLL